MADPSPAPAPLPTAVGRVTISAGLLLLAFAAYQLWGTGLTEARAQRELATELAATLIVDQGPSGRPEPEPVEQGLPGETVDAIDIGQPFATLRIPAIGLDKTVVEGTTREALRTGPGHYRGTARPGRPGNVAIAGHRTTHGAPFNDIDRLAPGDPIVVETAAGTFTYRVEAQTSADGHRSGHRIVAPEDVHVIADKGDHRLTLTACHPRYSARQRIVVTAVLDRRPPPDQPVSAAAVPTLRPPSTKHTTIAARSATTSATASPATAAPVDDADDLGWQTGNLGPAAGWAALTALVVGGAWVFGRLWRRVPAYLMAGPSFTLCLATCFGHLDRLLPAG